MDCPQNLEEVHFLITSQVGIPRICGKKEYMMSTIVRIMMNNEVNGYDREEIDSVRPDE